MTANAISHFDSNPVVSGLFLYISLWPTNAAFQKLVQTKEPRCPFQFSLSVACFHCLLEPLSSETMCLECFAERAIPLWKTSRTLQLWSKSTNHYELGFFSKTGFQATKLMKQSLLYLIFYSPWLGVDTAETLKLTVVSERVVLKTARLNVSGPVIYRIAHPSPLRGFTRIENQVSTHACAQHK